MLFLRSSLRVQAGPVPPQDVLWLQFDLSLEVRTHLQNHRPEVPCGLKMTTVNELLALR